MSPFYAGVLVGSILGFFAFPWFLYAVHCLESAVYSRRVRESLATAYEASKAPGEWLAEVVIGWRTAPPETHGKHASKDRVIAQRSG